MHPEADAIAAAKQGYTKWAAAEKANRRRQAQGKPGSVNNAPYPALYAVLDYRREYGLTREDVRNMPYFDFVADMELLGHKAEADAKTQTDESTKPGKMPTGYKITGLNKSLTRKR